MRPLWKDILIAVWLGMILPGIVLNAFVLQERHREIPQVQPEQGNAAQNNSRFIPVRDSDGTCRQMELDH